MTRIRLMVGIAVVAMGIVAYGDGKCADTVVYGTIRTAETEKPVAEALAIKDGKWADFVLVDQDVFDCPVTDIRKTKVVSTWFEGSEVYSRNVK